MGASSPVANHQPLDNLFNLSSIHSSTTVIFVSWILIWKLLYHIAVQHLRSLFVSAIEGTNGGDPEIDDFGTIVIESWVYTWRVRRTHNLQLANNNAIMACSIISGVSVSLKYGHSMSRMSWMFGSVHEVHFVLAYFMNIYIYIRTCRKFWTGLRLLCL